MPKSVQVIDGELLTEVEAGCAQRNLTCKLRNRLGVQTLTMRSEGGLEVKFKAPKGSRGQGILEFNGRTAEVSSVWAAMNALWMKSQENNGGNND